MKLVVEKWHAVYRRNPDSTHPNAVKLHALFRFEEDAKTFHDNPDLYFNARRQVKLQPGPIEIFEIPPAPAGSERAVELLNAIVNGPDDKMPLDEARSFLKRLGYR